ncbi:unnamed protein product [Discosporangium mesarthrocarpum]
MPPNSMAVDEGAPTASSRLMKAEKFQTGMKVWTDDEEEVWISVEVVKQESTVVTVKNRSTGEVLDIDLGFAEIYPQNPKVVSDMTALHHIHEAGILYNLGKRAEIKDQRPYTFMGTILIAVNPLRATKSPEMSVYMDRPLNPDSPHPYAIAELAYHQMRLGSKGKATNQSIVVSGESGAGKTETSKIMLRFLTQRSAGVGGVSGLEDRVVDSSPILESFGNAKTLRNNNSSRFGKFLKLQFSADKFSLAGAFIETYLLEKSRVLSQGQGERNFHILYELVAGASRLGLSGKLKLEAVEDYPILSQSSCVTLPGVDDAEHFAGVQKAFTTIGLDADTQMQVWQALSAVLNLSKFVLGTKDDEQGEVATIADIDDLQNLGDLLGVDMGALESLLIQRVVKTRGEVFTKKLDLQDATRTRDAVVKALYQAMFLWVVQVINISLGKGADSLPFIGVLDIFGFENFEHKNEYEQLLINFTNENLQDTFNKQVFNNELVLYEQEGIDVAVSSCPDNAECLLMLSAKPQGIIPALDNVCSEPNPTDLRYTAQLHKLYSRHQNFPVVAKKDQRDKFWVKHYAGKVKYTVEGWVERNMDRIPEAFTETLKSSSLKVVKEAGIAFQVPAKATASKRPGKALVRPTVAKAFLASMASLNSTLFSTTCNFVRCIKPNSQMAVGVFSNKYVVEQLQCLGILQTCEVLKVGMPTRVTYAELKEVLGAQAADAEKLFKGEPETALIAAILWAFEVPSESFRLGKTRVFFKAGQISTLEKILRDSSAEKGAWVFSRLEEALANRHKAKAAAEGAQAALDEAKKAIVLARNDASKLLDFGEGDNEERGPAKVIYSGPSEEDLYPLQSASKKARKASSTASQQIRDLLVAAEEDEIGKYAKGAKERVIASSEEYLAVINAAGDLADELDAGIAAAKGEDDSKLARMLEDSLDRLELSLVEAEGMATAAEEAAAKCQASTLFQFSVDKTAEKAAATKRLADDLLTGAASVSADAKSALDNTKRKQEAFEKTKVIVPRAVGAVDKAFKAFSTFKEVIEKAGEEEEKARDAYIAEEERKVEELAKAAALAAEEAKERARLAELAKDEEARKAAADAAKMAQEAAEAAAHEESCLRLGHAELRVWKLMTLLGVDFCLALNGRHALHRPVPGCTNTSPASPMCNFLIPSPSTLVLPPYPISTHKGNLLAAEQADVAKDMTGPSTAPPDRSNFLSRGRSSSVKDMLVKARTPDASLSPARKPKKKEEGEEPRSHDAPKIIPGGVPGGVKNFEAMFNEALENGTVEGHLMKQSKFFSRWKPRYFQLENGYLTYYDKKSLVGARKNKGMELTSQSITSYTNTRSCFCVRTGDMVWFLLAKDENSMNKWMTAINAQIHGIFMKNYVKPEDNYWKEGIKGRFFYRMVVNALPQWIRTYPEAHAPRTGDGLFPGEVIEVDQVLAKDNATYLRIASDRGWTYAKNPGDQTILFEEISGEVVDDHRNYGFPTSAREPVPILFGPGLESQQTGEALIPGERAEAIERFTPNDGLGVVFIKLADGRGWVPVRKKNSTLGGVSASIHG